MFSQIAERQIIAHLYREEEYRQFAYDDANGKTVTAPIGNLSFGIGWNIQINGCPKPIAEFAAMYFFNQCDLALTNAITGYTALDEVRRMVLADMAYNMGVGNVLKFTSMITAMAKADWHTAAIAMLQSRWAREVGQRAVNLSQMMETGQWLKKKDAMNMNANIAASHTNAALANGTINLIISFAKTALKNYESKRGHADDVFYFTNRFHDDSTNSSFSLFQ